MRIAGWVPEFEPRSSLPAVRPAGHIDGQPVYRADNHGDPQNIDEPGASR